MEVRAAPVAAYYVVSEALTIVAKHAHAMADWVSATLSEGTLVLQVVDDSTTVTAELPLRLLNSRAPDTEPPGRPHGYGLGFVADRPLDEAIAELRSLGFPTARRSPAL